MGAGVWKTTKHAFCTLLKSPIIRYGRTHTLITFEPVEVQHHLKHVHLKDEWVQKAIIILPCTLCSKDTVGAGVWETTQHAFCPLLKSPIIRYGCTHTLITFEPIVVQLSQKHLHLKGK
jgi:hypothetical protein